MLVGKCLLSSERLTPTLCGCPTDSPADTARQVPVIPWREQQIREKRLLGPMEISESSQSVFHFKAPAANEGPSREVLWWLPILAGTWAFSAG